MASRFTKWRAMARTPVGATAAVLLVLAILLAVFGPILWGGRAAIIDTDNLQGDPSAQHWIGTDSLGRDLFYRTLVAGRLSLVLALIATAIGVVIGTLLGTAPSVLPRRLGRIVVAVVNVAVAFPGLLLALFFAVIFGVGTVGAVLAIGLAMAPGFARLTQTLSAGVAGREFVAAAKVSGVGRFRLLVRHILPNIGEPLVVQATIGAGGALLAFAGLSFLGIGVQAPDYDWGALMNEGLNRVYTNPLAALAPGLMVVLTGLAFNLFGETAAALIGLRLGSIRKLPARPAAAESVQDGTTTDEPVLSVQNLQVSFPAAAGWITPVRGVSFAIGAGESVGVVGESGSGKSLTALAVSRLIELPGRVTADRLDFLGKPVLAGSDRVVRHHLGMNLAMVFQDPMTSFNPTRRVGRQLAEVSEQHQGLSRSAALARAVDRLRSVRVPAAQRRARQYPHEFSGGMRQRAMIAMGLMAEPKLIVADEPTTALDVTVQRQVLALLAKARADRGAAILLISHDITVVSQTCDRILVMYAGRIVEDLPATDLATAPRHPYTRALMAAVPDMETDRDADLAVIPGRPPEPGQFGTGCAFADRCAFADNTCRSDDPVLLQIGLRHRVACHHPIEPGAGRPEFTKGLAGNESGVRA